MILAALDSSPFVLEFVSIALGIVLVGFVLRLFKQTNVIIYIITGVIVGPHVTGLVDDTEMISSIGSMGLVLMLFFVGMEISLEKLVASWRVSVVGTVLQILFSVGVVYLLGQYYEWTMARVLTIGFVISLSSTAVLVKILNDTGEINQRVGQNVLGILLVQDVMIVPMLIALSYVSGVPINSSAVILQIVGGILISALVGYMIIKKELKLPFHKVIKNDHEMQLFLAFVICFGFSALTAFFGLSSALGAFIGGILVATAKSTSWVHHSLESLKIIFVALFFISVGMLIDLQFLIDNISEIIVLVLVVFITNNIINSVIMRGFNVGWKESLYTGALLSQVGEFSFVIGNLAYYNEIITDYAYQIIVSMISLTLLLSPAWINISRKITKLPSSKPE